MGHAYIDIIGEAQCLLVRSVGMSRVMNLIKGHYDLKGFEAQAIVEQAVYLLDIDSKKGEKT